MRGWISKAVVLLGVLCLGAQVQAAQTRAWYGSMVAVVTLDASGAVQTMDWVDGDAGPVGALLLAHLRQTRFQAYQLDGRAVAGQGHVRVLLRAEREGRRFRRLALHGVIPFIANESPVPPRYPAEALRRGIQGTVVLQVRFDATGKAEEVGHRSEHAVPEILIRPAAEAAAHWVFQPERLEGVAQPGVQVVPVSFAIENGRHPRRTLELGQQRLTLQTEAPQVALWASSATLQFDPPGPWGVDLD